ncbi:transcription termination/antitermination NusG family protein [Fibrobacterota bacterium]
MKTERAFNENEKEKWYAVYTRSKCEKVVKKDISEYCVVYLPIQIVKRKWSDRYKKLEVPLIPSYVFAKFSGNNRFRIYRHPNVVTIVGINGRPNPIPEKEIDLVRRIEASRLPFQFTRSDYHLNLGDKLLFNSGPLMGEEGYLQRFLNNSKVYLHVPSLNGYFVADIKKVSPHYSEMEIEEVFG